MSDSTVALILTIGQWARVVAGVCLVPLLAAAVGAPIEAALERRAMRPGYIVAGGVA